MANPPGFFVDETGRAHVPFSTGTTAAPTTGTWAVGNLAVTTAGVLYVCTVAGTPGTWATVSGSSGGFSLARTAVKTSNYSAAVNDLIPCDTTSAGFTVTLPTAPADKSLIAVKLVTLGGTNAVTIATGGSDVFNKTSGATTRTLNILNESVLLEYTASGAIWTTVAGDTPLSSLDSRIAATYAPLRITKTTQTGDYTTQLADSGTILEGNKATAMTFTIPSGVHAVGDVMEFVQFGAGAITVAAGGGVTFPFGPATTTAQGQSLFARQRATDEWVITGSVQLGEIGYAAITTDVTQAAVGNALVAGLSTTVTAPGGRPLRITCSGNLKQSTAGSGVAMTIEEDGTQILEVPFVAGANNEIVPAERSVRRTPSAGLHTYRVRLYATTSGTGTLLCAANNPAFIQVVQL